MYSPSHQIVLLQRLQKKIAARDRKIAGLQRYIRELEHNLAERTLAVETLTRNMERCVMHALSNVRLMPILGVGKSDKIVEVIVKKED